VQILGRGKLFDMGVIVLLNVARIDLHLVPIRSRGNQDVGSVHLFRGQESFRVSSEVFLQRFFLDLYRLFE